MSSTKTPAMGALGLLRLTSSIEESLPYHTILRMVVPPTACVMKVGGGSLARHNRRHARSTQREKK
eukprot:6212284-Pleurochrysis_carterae.AAC.2